MDIRTYMQHATDCALPQDSDLNLPLSSTVSPRVVLPREPQPEHVLEPPSVSPDMSMLSVMSFGPDNGMNEGLSQPLVLLFNVAGYDFVFITSELVHM